MSAAKPEPNRTPLSHRFLRWLGRTTASLCIVCGLFVVILLFLNTRTPSQTDPQTALSGKPAIPLRNDVDLKLLTLDLRGRFHLPGEAARTFMERVARVAASQAPDVAVFQEVLNQQDRDILVSALGTAGLPQHHYFPSGLRGSGLLVVSRFPIVERCFHRFVAGGDWFRPWHGDWYMGKGVAFVRLQLPNNAGDMDLFAATLQAQYANDDYLGTRERQAKELSNFVGQLAGKAPALVAISPVGNNDTDGPAHLTRWFGVTPLSTIDAMSTWFARNAPTWTLQTASTVDLGPLMPSDTRDRVGLFIRPRGEFCQIHVAPQSASGPEPAPPAAAPSATTGSPASRPVPESSAATPQGTAR